MCDYVWLDGEYVHLDEAMLPITTHALHYGTTVFEGIRAYWNGTDLNVFRLDDHIRRFRKSGQFYNITLNYTDQQVAEAVTGICRRNNIKTTCYIRPFYFVGEHGIALHVTPETHTRMAIFAFPFGDMFNRDGISTIISPWRKFSDMSTPIQAKMGGNYLNSIIATGSAKDAGADEALLLNTSGNISEAPGENIFIVRKGRLLTPNLTSSVLEGITRDTILEIAAESGIPPSEKEISQSELMTADEVFLTGTAAQIVPVLSINSHPIGSGSGGGGGGGPGRITRTIMDKYNDLVMGKVSKYAHWLTSVY